MLRSTDEYETVCAQSVSGMQRSFLYLTIICITGCLGSMNYASRQPGSTGGLVIALRVHQDDYLYASSPAAGFRVSTLGHFVFPTNNQSINLLKAKGPIGHLHRSKIHNIKYINTHKHILLRVTLKNC